MGQCLKICEGLLPENGRLHCYFWSDYLNFDARSLDAPIQGASIYIERIDLASKLR